MDTFTCNNKLIYNFRGGIDGTNCNAPDALFDNKCPFNDSQSQNIKKSKLIQYKWRAHYSKWRAKAKQENHIFGWPRDTIE